MGASVIAGMDAPPVFEAGEEVFDFVSLPIENGIVTLLNAMFGVGRDAGGDAALRQRFTESDRAIGAVGEQLACGGQIRDHGHCRGMVAGLAFGQAQQDRSPQAVAYDMQLGGQPAPAASDRSG